MDGPLAVLVALGEEERAIERLFRSRERTGHAPARFRRGEIEGMQVALGRSGVGRERAREAAAALLDAERPGALIVAGFGGALREGLSPGDIVVGSVVTEEGGSGSWAAEPRLLQAALGIRSPDLRVSAGKIVTVTGILSSAEAKRGLAEATGGDAADMESSGALRAAAERKTPALCVRAIFDERSFDLPFDPARVVSPDGDVHTLQALRAIAAHPKGLLSVGGLRSRAKAASRSLGAFLAALARELGRGAA